MLYYDVTEIMSEFCNNLFFYDNPPIALSQILLDLNPYMYTTNIKLPEKSEITEKEHPSLTIDTIKSINDKKTLKVIVDLITPKQKDSLFWCLYIIAHGYNDFQQITRNHSIKKLEIQKQVIDLIQKDKSIMKKTNIKYTNVAIQELTSDLISITKEINYSVAMSLCVLYNINLFIIDKKKGVYIKFISNIDIELPSYAIFREEYNTYSVDIEALTPIKILDLEKMICLESYLTPLKTISNYKVTELMEKARQLNLLEDDKKYKKQELYELIYNKIRWK